MPQTHALSMPDPFDDLNTDFDDIAGDETTTAGLIAAAIFVEGVHSMEAGASAVALRRGLDRGMTAYNVTTINPAAVDTLTRNCTGDERIGALILKHALESTAELITNEVGATGPVRIARAVLHDAVAAAGVMLLAQALLSGAPVAGRAAAKTAAS